LFELLAVAAGIAGESRADPAGGEEQKVEDEGGGNLENSFSE
jgi:hypothetical protein